MHMKPFRTAVLCAALSFAPLSQADVITDWNHTAADVMKAANVSGNPYTRAMAMVHVAMADAVNTVQGRYTRFTYNGPAAPRASAEAAAAAAAHDMLVRLIPTQKAKIDEVYAASLKPVAEGTAKKSGIEVGEQASAAVFADRANDATNVPDTYRPVTTPGVWIPTVLPLFPHYAQAKPWALERADVFRPAPPPALSSALYARDYNETRELGAAKSTKRTPEQAEAVKFWTQANLTPAWFTAADQLAAARKLDLADNARLFALLAMGLGNAFILDWDAKFQYNAWRPMTAIRNGDRDGNDATERDAGWTPLNQTPMHPEYPSQAGINNGTAVGVLHAVFGRGPADIVITDSADPKLKRSFTSVQQLSDEQKAVRVWGGVHFRNSVEVGEAMGRRNADFLTANTIKPTQNVAEAR
jgi:hypothetical protein